jgi:uncharacterized coiled-coil DUF342 family protein
MSSRQNKLIKELNEHKLDVSKLKNQLNELDKEKESWFRKNKELSRRIREAIQKIRKNKAKRDFLTQEVKELKLKRDNANKEISIKLKELDKLRNEEAKLAKSLAIKEPSSEIRQHIKTLEFKIETEALPFDKEQALMKKIKELEKLYEESSILDEYNKRIKETYDLIRKIKKESNDAHQSVQEKAEQSQLLHEGILKSSDEIDTMKVDEEATFKKFLEFKQKFHKVNTQLKEKLESMNDVKSKLDKIYHEKQEKRRKEQESFLKSKEEEINQKIIRKEKLTTEDLLVFQNSSAEKINFFSKKS